MRKWMRERMKRRKQKSEPAQPGQASAPPEPPLQPAYFDHSESPSERTESAGIEPEPARLEDAETPAPEPQGEAPGEPSTPARVPNRPAAEAPRRRRRRGRGGRGRGPAPTQVPLPPLQPTLIPASESASRVRQAGATSAPPVAGSPKGIVILAIGLPGSGKSSWFKRHNIRALSSDLLRDLLFDDATEQRYQDLVFSNLRSLLKARMIARRPMNYVDATNLTPHDRHTWIKLARDYGYDVHAVFFDVPLEVCMERNQRRHRVVPEEAMRRMAAKFRPPTFEEGFSKITVVRVKKKGAAS
ncbi:MAG TPA: AAA family ATPase [Terriglobales bacterium]